MSDTTYEKFQHYGTAAQRAAFVPAPAVGIQPIYIWFETDTGDTYLYHTAWVLLGTGGSVVPRYGVIGLVIEGASGGVITTGVKGFIQIPFAATILEWTILSTDAGTPIVGSIVVDIWKDTYANFPPTVADTITAAAKPTVTAANKATNNTLVGWVTSIAAGDILGFNVDSIGTFTRVVIQLKIQLI